MRLLLGCIGRQCTGDRRIRNIEMLPDAYSGQSVRKVVTTDQPRVDIL